MTTTMLTTLRAWALLFVLMLGACQAPQDLPPYAIDAPRLLGVRITPAQAKPGEVVQREVLAVDALGQRILTPPTFARCELPKTLGERSLVSQACLMGQGLVPISARDPIDRLSCQRFGPTPLPAKNEEDPRPRPVPPDKSGGYYSPEQIQIPGTPIKAFYRIRTQCDLLGATREVFDDYNARFQPNQGPSLQDAQLTPAPRAQEANWQIQVPIGQPIDLSLKVAASLAQTYIIYEIPRNQIVEARESLTLRWYAHGATLERSEETLEAIDLDREAAFSNKLTLGPTGQANLWLVLQDSRGAMSWRQISVFGG